MKKRRFDSAAGSPQALGVKMEREVAPGTGMDEELRSYLDGKFAAVDAKLTQMDAKFEAKFAAVDAKLAQMDAKFEAKFAAVDAKFAAIDTRFTELEERLVETMRGMQTELLRGFESFSSSQIIRLRKLEVDQSNLDASLSGRMAAIETRLLQIEFRLKI
jgi:hypothetical protein